MPQCDAWELMVAILEMLSKHELEDAHTYRPERTVLPEYVVGLLFRERSSCTVCSTSFDCLRLRNAIDTTIERGKARISVTCSSGTVSSSEHKVRGARTGS